MSHRNWLVFVVPRFTLDDPEDWRTQLDNQDDEKPDTAPSDAPVSEPVGPL